MAFFKITLMRSAIGLPEKTRGVLNALGLRKRMATVFLPVNTSELVAVSEVEKALTKAEVKAQRTPDPGYYIEKPGLGAG